MVNHNIVDLGFEGSKFTWHRGNLHQRLDRALGNDLGQSEAPNSSVRHLHKLKSNHRPILVSSFSIPDGRKERPFRALAGWFGHVEFREVVKNSWCRGFSVPERLDHFTNLVKS